MIAAILIAASVTTFNSSPPAVVVPPPGPYYLVLVDPDHGGLTTIPQTYKSHDACMKAGWESMGAEGEPHFTCVPAPQ